jgi:hypothetical protein
MRGSISHHFFKLLCEKGLEPLVKDDPDLDVVQEGYLVVVELLVALHLNALHDGVVVNSDLIVADGRLFGSGFLS